MKKTLELLFCPNCTVEQVTISENNERSDKEQSAEVDSI